MRVKDGNNYVLVGSQGGAPKNPVWVHNLRAQPVVEIRDLTVVQPMKVREVMEEAERARLWALAVKAFPPYAEYQAKTTRKIRSSSPSRRAGRRMAGACPARPSPRRTSPPSSRWS
jgi:deazaflavin-dependent oxidoreductase (nitroreductase family)